jgi:sirohydrochlorin cobaltochelatase
MPLLFARGVHALRDMAGECRNSWQTGLTAAGFSCACHVKGAGEHQALAEIWLDHLHEAVARLHDDPAGSSQEDASRPQK